MSPRECFIDQLLMFAGALPLFLCFMALALVPIGWMIWLHSTERVGGWIKPFMAGWPLVIMVAMTAAGCYFPNETRAVIHFLIIDTNPCNCP